jgi:hypothetical protein
MPERIHETLHPHTRRSIKSLSRSGRYRRTLLALLGATMLLISFGCQTNQPGGDNPPPDNNPPPDTTECALRAGEWPGNCWRPYAENSAFNTPITADALLDPTKSQPIVDRILGDMARRKQPANLVIHTQGSAGEPTYFVDTRDTTTFRWYDVTCVEFQPTPPTGCSIDRAHLKAAMAAEGLPGDQVPIPPTAAAEGSPVRSATQAQESTVSDDRHITVVDVASKWEYDLWHAPRQLPPNGGALNIGFGGRTRIDGDGISTADGDATAAGFASLAGRVRAEEMIAGEIKHGLFINFDCDNGDFVDPARKRSKKLDCATVGKTGGNTNAPPMGTRLQLIMTDNEFEDLPVPAWKKTLLQAMRTYGMFFGDTGTSSFYFVIETESGNQYLSNGKTDQWQEFAKKNNLPLKQAAPDYLYEHYLGSFFGTADGFDWNSFWTKPGRLVVVDPCFSRPQHVCMG